LLTLTGPGGVGKTRLAVEAVANQVKTFADGVYFVSLASVSGGEFIVPAIASAIGFVFYGPTDPQTQLLNYLQEKTLLLVLDNFEHLLVPVENEASSSGQGVGIDLLADLLQQAPNVKLLVTSRERLNLQGEWVFEVTGLPSPPAELVENLATPSAIALFVQSAQRVDVAFALTQADYPAVARLCRLLEGLPLGIELAASWVRVLTCADLVREIEHNLDVLTTSMRNVPARHRSLRAAFDHSWKLLTGPEQQVMRRLSVFRGGFEREAAERVAGATLPVLSALVDKSLLRRAENRGYELHELIRQYAAWQLQADIAEAAATRDRHAVYYTGLLQQQKLLVISPRQKEALARLTIEIDNLRSAWDWSLSQGCWVNLDRAAPGFFWFYERKNWYQEGVITFGRAVDILPAAPHDESDVLYTAALGQVVMGLGVFSFRCSQNEQAKALLSRSVTTLRLFSQPAAPEAPVALLEMLVLSLFYQGVVCFITGDNAQARPSFEEGLAISRANQLTFTQGACLIGLGIIAQAAGDLSQAKEMMSEGVACLRSVGDPAILAWALSYASGAARVTGNLDEARQQLNESLELSRSLDDRWSAATALYFLGLLAQAQQDYDTAQTQLADSAAMFRQIGVVWNLARSLKDLAYVTYAAGAPVEAEQRFIEALKVAFKANILNVALDTLVGLATIYAQANEGERALDLIACVQQHPGSTQEVKDRAERLRTEVEAKLFPAQVEAAQVRAQAMPFESVVAEILTTAMVR
jgi:predicted ATPase